jgi:cysteine desulfurase/selenocysteine lyase
MNLQQEFPLKHDLIYLNHAAVAPWPTRTRQAVQQFAEENNVYGSMNYLTWLEVEKQLRHRLKQLINAASCDDVALLKNTSEALSIVAYGLQWRNGDNVVISDEEFPSNRNLKSAHQTPEESLIALCDERTRVLSISSVQYASGLRLELSTLGKFCRDTDILFCVDAIQSVGAVVFDVQKDLIDFAMADGHKWMLGPEGLAFFYSSEKARNKLKLTQYGWHMVEHAGDFDRVNWTIAPDSRRFECGSPNMLGIHALNASLSLLLETGMETVESEIHQRTDQIIHYLQDLESTTVLSSVESNRRAGIVTFKHHSIDSESLYKRLTGHNVMCAMRGGGVRFSPHFYTPLDKIQQALQFIPS